MIGSKIAEALKKMNISQAQLAENLFISGQAVGKWERGESLPDILTLDRLAKILGVDLNCFSENFPSAGYETTNGDSPWKQPAELSKGTQKNRHNWNMSRGNWVDADFSGADLTGVTMRFSAFAKNTVADAVWNRTTFNASHLSEIIFEGTWRTAVLKTAVLRG